MSKELEPDDSHWVETLFPPHFSMLTLMEDDSCGSLQALARFPEPSSFSHLGSQRSFRRQDIYKTTLQRVQQREEQQRKEALVGRIVREDEKGELSSGHVGHGNPDVGQSQGDAVGGREGESRRCIWNDRDIVVLQKALHEVEEDRGRLKAQLRDALAEAQCQGGERRRLQGLLEEREQELGLARQEAARRALHVEALQAEGCRTANQLEAQAAEVKCTIEEKRRLSDRLKKVTKQEQEARRENTNLAWDTEKLKKQLKTEVKRQEEASRLEHNVVLQRLHRELEETKAELKLEKQRHTNSLSALELLRRHFNNQSPGMTQARLTDKITHI